MHLMIALSLFRAHSIDTPLSSLCFEDIYVMYTIYELPFVSSFLFTRGIVHMQFKIITFFFVQ